MRSPLGLLFGSIEDHRVSVEHFRSFPASNTGPSPKDAHLDTDFEKCFAAVKDDGELRSLSLIGWYGTRSSAEGPLLDEELDFHNRHFRRVCDIALILDGDKRAASLNFYSRWANSAMCAERHRWGCTPAPNGSATNDPIDVSMRARVNEHYQERVYEVLHAMREAQRTGKGIAFAPKDPEFATAEPTDANEQAIFQETPPNAKSADPHETEAWLRLAAQTRSGAKSRRKLWLVVAAIVVLSAAFIVRRFYSHRAPRALRQDVPISAIAKNISTDFGLRAEHHGNALLLRWNQSSEPMQSANSGKLEIRDGSQFNEIQLDANEIAKGGLSYNPTSSDVSFRLDVLGNHGSTYYESIRVLDGSKLVSGLNVSEKASQEVPTRAGAVAVRTPFTDVQSGKRSTYTPEQRLPPQARNGDTEVERRTNASDGGEISSKAATPISPRPDDRPQFNPIANRESDAATQRSESDSRKITGEASRPVYIRAQPVKRVTPAGVFGQSIYSPVKIDVQVRIDETGHVTEAHAARNVSGVNESLLSAAVSAAKEWVFQPATIGGKKISSDQLIEFRFSPESR